MCRHLRVAVVFDRAPLVPSPECQWCQRYPGGLMMAYEKVRETNVTHGLLFLIRQVCRDICTPQLR